MPLSSMRILILLLVVSLFLSNYSFADLDPAESSKREQANSKISQILLKLQTSDNPNEFAKANGLLYQDGMIQVYVHLIDEEFLSHMPPEINVVASDQKIAVAYVTPQQLDIFENLDYVERVTIPDLAIDPPLPQTATANEFQKKEQNNFTLFSFLAIAIIIGTIMMIFLKIKKSKNRLDT